MIIYIIYTHVYGFVCMCMYTVLAPSLVETGSATLTFDLY